MFENSDGPKVPKTKGRSNAWAVLRRDPLLDGHGRRGLGVVAELRREQRRVADQLSAHAAERRRQPRKVGNSLASSRVVVASTGTLT